MRKIFLLLSMWCVVASASANTNQKVSEGPVQVFEKGFLKQNLMAQHSSGVSACKAPSSLPEQWNVTEVITKAEGELKHMSKACGGYYVDWDWVLKTYNRSNVPSQIIFGENNEVYFYNILSEEPTNTYVKGTLEGNEITLPLPQTTIFSDELGYGYNLCVLKLEYVIDEYGEEVLTYVVDDEKDSVTFTIDEEGRFTLEDIDDNILGFAYTDDGSWVGFGDLYQNYTPLEWDIVTMPEGIATERYSFIYGNYGYFVNVGIDNGYLYIEEICPLMPGATVRGKIDGDIVSIAQNEMIGIFNGSYIIYTKCVYADGEDLFLTDENLTYDLIVDSENKTIRSVNPDIMLCLNAANDYVYYVQLFDHINMFVQENMNGTPSNPYNISFADYSFLGFYNLRFNISNLSVTNDYILDLYDMYYRIFYDDEIMEFTKGEGDEYRDIPEGQVWTEIPLNTNNHDFYFYGQQVILALYSEGFKTLGAQLIYKHDGTVTYSDIAVCDIATGETSVRPFNPGEDGVEKLNESHIISSAYYDLNGNQISLPAAGICIRRDVCSDGSVKTHKIMINR